MKQCVIALACALFALAGWSQNRPELIPPIGHSIVPSDFDVHVDGTTVVTVGLDGKMIFWDLNTQTAFRVVQAHTAESYSVRYSWDVNYIITSSVDGTVKIWQTNGEPYKTIEVGTSVLFAEMDRAEERIAVATSDGHVRIYSFPEIDLLHDIEAHDSPVNFAVFSTNGNLVFSGDKGGYLRAFDTRNSNKRMLDLQLEAEAKMVSFDWSGSAMVIHTMDGLPEILLLPKFQSIGRLPVPTVSYSDGAIEFVSQLDISPDSKWIAMANKLGQIQVVSGDTMVKAAMEGRQFETAAINIPNVGMINKVKFMPSMNYLVGLDVDKKLYAAQISGVDLTHVEGQYVSIKILEQSTDFPRSVFFDRENELHIRGFHTYSWDLETGQHKTELISTGRERFLKEGLDRYESDIVFYVDEKRDIILPETQEGITDPDEMGWSPTRKMGFAVFQDKVYLFNTASRQITSYYEVPWKTAPDVMAISHTGNLICSQGKKVIAYSSKGKKLWSYESDENVTDIAVSYDGDLAAIGSFGYELNILDMERGKVSSSIKTKEAETEYLTFLPNGRHIAYAGFQNTVGVMDLEGNMVHELDGAGLSVFQLAASSDGRTLATLGYDRLVRLYDLKNNQLTHQVFTMEEYGMAITNAEGFYMSDKKAYQQLAFFYQDKIYSGDQFDAIMNRPDLVMASSPYVDQAYLEVLTAAWEKRMKRLGMSDLQMPSSTPYITIENRNELTTNTNDRTIQLSLSIRDSVDRLEKIMIWVNDVPLFGRDGMELNHEHQDKVSIDIPLLPEKNYIKFSATNSNGVSSLAETMEIHSFAEDDPTLYLVTLGTSKYKDSRFDLEYAAKDATDLASLFKETDQFKDVQSLVLTDDQVTHQSIDDIRVFLNDAGPNDVVILFVAGHGLLDNELDYYLATHETDFLDPTSTGISYEALESLLESIAALRKVLFMDTCHSGEIDKEDVSIELAEVQQEEGNIQFRSSGNGVLSTNKGAAQTSMLSRELFADMRSGTGANVVSSAGGVEFAMESDQWNNGLFTYCLLNGIQTKDADLNGDGAIMLSELQEYVGQKVSRMSGGKQQPTSRVENLTMDFRIW